MKPMRPIYALFDLEGKAAIVTGASRGLGYGIAECLAKAGVHVIVANRDATAGAKAKKSLGQHGTRVPNLPTDVSDSHSVEVSNIMLEYTVLDLTDLETPESGKEIVLLGQSGDEQISLEELATCSNGGPLDALMAFEGRLSHVHGGTP